MIRVRRTILTSAQLGVGAWLHLILEAEAGPRRTWLLVESPDREPVSTETLRRARYMERFRTEHGAQAAFDDIVRKATAN